MAKKEIQEYEGCIHRLTGEKLQLKKVLARIRGLVDKQAEDEGLWGRAVTAPEAYLQQELRKLHKLIEE